MPSDGRPLGEQLLALGWKQGCLLPVTAPVVFVERVAGSPPRWEQRSRPIEGSLVLATQTCDLKKQVSEEPTVEFLRAFWTANPRITVPAGRNSVRHFLLRERRGERGTEGLVAEASNRVLVEKRSLLEFQPEGGCDSARCESRFRRWLGRRYDRPAVPDAIVAAVQKPVVDALRGTAEDAEVWSLLSGAQEVLFDTEQVTPPFKVTLLFVRAEPGSGMTPVSESDAEKLAAWFTGVLAGVGEAEVDKWEAADTSDISVRDYVTFIALPLDEYSL